MRLQNDVDFGLTAGIHSLDTDECEAWIAGIQAGNLYVNRGITGAIVNRQPFGGWKRSSVGASAKAGGPNYLSQLRNWAPISNFEKVKVESQRWWNEIGSVPIDRAGLQVERNYQRYCHYSEKILVRIDSTVSSEVLAYLKWLATYVDVDLEISTSQPISDVLSLMANRSLKIGKVRWLSSEPAPIVEFLTLGVSVDSRAVTSVVEVEIPRWLREQSLAITNHRYGNVGAGSKPVLPNQKTKLVIENN